jgi:drug/metabolite transporter (DMT)-like permease
VKLTHPGLPAYVSLAVAILCLGFSGIFVKWAGAPGIVTSFYRMAIGAAIMAIPFSRRLRTRRGLPRAGVILAVFGGVFFAADLGLWATGVMLGGATNPTLFGNTAPLWVGLGAALLFRERLGMVFWAGLILALAGAAIVLGVDVRQAAALGLGSLLGLLAAVFYGGYFLISQRGRETLDALSYFWLSAVSATAVLLGAGVLLRLPLTGYPATAYMNFLGLGVLTQATGYMAINYALGHLPASVVAPTMMGQPIVTALLAGPLLGETLRTGQIFGGAMVLAGVYVVHRSRGPRPAEPTGSRARFS